MIRWLVDAQLPARLAQRLREAGHDAIHTSELPLGNATPDREINRLSIEQQRIVITKDADFVDTFLRRGQPYKLLVISAGNLRNQELFEIVDKYLAQLVESFAASSYVELKRHLLVLHR
ncbi:MAG TPA: DUF5615 family PIN-like protein [Oscillatoriaceae cyanobacterium]